jgi:hypothetical protein
MTGSALPPSFSPIGRVSRRVASAERKYGVRRPAIGFTPNKRHLPSVRKQIAAREESARRRQSGGTLRKKLRKVTRRRK